MSNRIEKAMEGMKRERLKNRKHNPRLGHLMAAQDYLRKNKMHEKIVGDS